MPTAIIDELVTRYETIGSGPPLLMFSPGGFDATIEKWATLGIYAKTKPLEHLARHFTCILFDRRECGKSSGRVEHVTWAHYVAQAKGLLKHLGIERAHMMGGCMGCSPVTAFAVAYPAMVQSMILFWPVGGAKYRISSVKRFAEHIEFISANGLPAVVSLVMETGKAFGADPRGGPWASAIKNDPAFAERFAKLSIGPYKSIVQDMARGLIDRDTAPGAEAEALLACEIPALIVPGADASHATSAARYLAECLPKSQYWDCPVDAQTEQATASKLLDFLQTSS